MIPTLPAARRGLGFGFLLPFCPLLLQAEDYFDRAPFLQQATSTSVLVVSQSSQKVLASCRYGLDGSSLDIILEDTEPVHTHLFALEGLAPGTLYDYQVDHGDRRWRLSFRTLPAVDGLLRVAVFGDSGWRDGADLGMNQDRVRQTLRSFAPDVLLHTGDLVYPVGHSLTYQANFFEVYTALLTRAVFFPSPGNHDCQADVEFYRDAFHLPENGPRRDELDYSFEAGDAHFVALNTCRRIDSRLEDWLKDDLGRTERRWKIVYFHHPPYSVGRHTGEGWVERNVVPLLEELGVDLVFSGHEHVYQRSYPIRDGRTRDGDQDPEFVDPDGIVYVVTGGGGAGIHEEVEDSSDARSGEHSQFFSVVRSVHHAVALDVRPTRLDVRAVDFDGQVIDRFSIRKGGEAPPEFRYISGDSNSSGSVTVTDSITILRFLFEDGVEICHIASDVNGSGEVSLTDAVQTLSALFLGVPNDAEPVGACITQETPGDTTGCRSGCGPS